jgi:hypothetical protein
MTKELRGGIAIHVRRTIHDGSAVNSCIEDAMH